MRKGDENVMEHGNGMIEIGEQSYTGRRTELYRRETRDTGKRPGRYRQETRDTDKGTKIQTRRAGRHCLQVGESAFKRAGANRNNEDLELEGIQATGRTSTPS